MNNNDPNRNLIKDESWRQDMNIVQDQNKFLQIKQKFFLNFDIWDSDQHEVSYFGFLNSRLFSEI